MKYLLIQLTFKCYGVPTTVVDNRNKNKENKPKTPFSGKIAVS